MQKAKISTKILISFASLYPNEDRPTMSDILQEIPSASAIEFVSYQSFITYYKLDKPLDFLIPWTLKVSRELQHKVTRFLQSRSLDEIIIFDKTAILLLLQHLISSDNHLVKELEQEDYTNILKAYLLCCDERIKTSLVDNIYSENQGLDNIVQAYIPYQMRFQEIDMFKDYRVEFIKIILFIDFCKSNVRFNTYLNLFLSEYKIDSWEYYVNFIFSTFLELSVNDKGATSKIMVDSQSLFGIDFMENMSINSSEIVVSSDFTSMRNRPVYRVADNTYVVLFVNFYIDKLFQSFVFDLAKVLKKHEYETQISGFPALKRQIAFVFSEKCLFYTIMNGCFSKYATLLYNGEYLHSIIGDGEPDFYIRHKSRVIIFEYKDVILSANIKHSGKFEDIYLELLEQFEKSTIEKGSKKTKKKPAPKGITQLINTIERVLPSIHTNPKIDKCDLKKLYVYPVIVYQDCAFETNGVNYILNKRFAELLKNRTTNDKYSVKGLVMININTLIQIEDYFSSGKIELAKCINDYIANFQSSNTVNSVVSFDAFIMERASLKGFKYFKTNRFQSIYDNLIEQERLIKKNKNLKGYD